MNNFKYLLNISVITSIIFITNHTYSQSGCFVLEYKWMIIGGVGNGLEFSEFPKQYKSREECQRGLNNLSRSTHRITIIKGCTICELKENESTSSSFSQIKKSGDADVGISFQESIAKNQSKNNRILNQKIIKEKLKEWQNSKNKSKEVGIFYMQLLKEIESLNKDLLIKNILCINDKCKVEWSYTEYVSDFTPSISMLMNNVDSKIIEKNLNLDEIVFLVNEVLNFLNKEQDNENKIQLNDNLEKYSQMKNNNLDLYQKNEKGIPVLTAESNYIYLDINHDGLPDNRMIFSKQNGMSLDEHYKYNSNNNDLIKGNSNYKELFEIAKLTTYVIDNRENRLPLKSISDYLSYYSTIKKTNDFIKNAKDENSVPLFQEYLNKVVKASTIWAVPSSKFSPTIDLFKNTFEASLNRTTNLVETGELSDESAVWAPISNWFQSITYTSNLSFSDNTMIKKNFDTKEKLKESYFNSLLKWFTK